MARHHVLVLSDCKAGAEQEYNDYYDHQHIPDILDQQPEVVSAQRFGVTSVFAPDGAPRWRFSTLYTLDTDDFDGYLHRMNELLQAGKLPPSAVAEPATAAVFHLVPLGPALDRANATRRESGHERN